MTSGIGIVRISGPEAFCIADRIFRFGDARKSAAELPANTVHYGHVCSDSEKREIIDEALLIIFKAPHSYTAEDTVEIDCHGGPYIISRILKACVDAGARLAEPGEFTKLAFLNGRIDLARAEAVMDVVNAASGEALKAAENQLSGRLSQKVSSIRSLILNETAFIEAAADDPEHYSLDGYMDELREKCQKAENELRALSASFEEGRVVREGVPAALLGKPNAGKSSILNLLSGSDRAIVTDVPGTTRDVLEETLSVGGLTLRLFDTAGIRQSDDEVERIGIKRARESAENASLLLLVFDGSRPLTEEDRELVSLSKGKNAICLVNKADLPQAFTAEELAGLFGGGADGKPSIIAFSAKTSEGKDELSEKIRRLYLKGAILGTGEAMITNARHREAVDAAAEALSNAVGTIDAGFPEDLLTVDLMDAYNSLGLITGDTAGEDLVNEIFSKFCMGK